MSNLIFTFQSVFNELQVLEKSFHNDFAMIFQFAMRASSVTTTAGNEERCKPKELHGGEISMSLSVELEFQLDDSGFNRYWLKWRSHHGSRSTLRSDFARNRLLKMLTLVLHTTRSSQIASHHKNKEESFDSYRVPNNP
jgi:hypothetical protein